MLNKKIIKQRWVSAKKEAQRVNKYLKKGYVGYFEGRKLFSRFMITKNGIYEPFGMGNQCVIIWYEKEYSYIGFYDTVEITKSKFRGIRFKKEQENDDTNEE